MADQRVNELNDWLGSVAPRHGLVAASLRPASDDASFRRYYRIDAPSNPNSLQSSGTLIIMDAPPPREDCRPFVHAAEVFKQAGVSVPEVLETDLSRGFLLLSDFGATTYLESLNADTAAVLYDSASAALVRIQQASRPGVFPAYDRALLERELMLYPDWYIARHRRVTLTDAEQNVLRAAFDALLANTLSQPCVYVHRDYHSRNLMVLAGADNPGILDFQDAVFGPITYDLVSLLRDAYIQWDEEQVLDWAIRFWDRARRAGLPVHSDFAEFYRDFEWMGLQRHIKVLGIFARLCYRDGKDRYLADMPLVYDYVIKTAKRYTAMAGLVCILERVEQDGQPLDNRSTDAPTVKK
jgi:N-acetylmuramate 1-kinase